jgi:hypothetical protein
MDVRENDEKLRIVRQRREVIDEVDRELEADSRLLCANGRVRRLSGCAGHTRGLLVAG